MLLSFIVFATYITEHVYFLIAVKAFVGIQRNSSALDLGGGGGGRGGAL
jgi:hypothetical protein